MTRRKRCYAAALPATIALWMIALPVRAQHEHPEPAAPESFEAVHYERERSIQLDAGPELVFPLFEPSGLSSWSRTWKLEALYPASGEARAGAVFLNHPAAHDFSTVWLVADHDPRAQRIRYVITIPEVEAWELEVQCVGTPEGKTVARVSYRITALSERANEWVRDFFEDDFEVGVDRMGTRINEYLMKKEQAGH